MFQDCVAVYHILYGLHSGIPICCIKAFLKDEAIKKMRWHYLPCDSCFRKGNKIKVHMCSGLCQKIQRMFSRWLFGYINNSLFFDDIY